MILLLVYPVVGRDGEFTRRLMDVFPGDTVAVVGTQNRNGYTGFKDMIISEFMEREHEDWVKIVQISLPSFAEKDKALFIFQRGNPEKKTATAN